MPVAVGTEIVPVPLSLTPAATVNVAGLTVTIPFVVLITLSVAITETSITPHAPQPGVDTVTVKSSAIDVSVRAVSMLLKVKVGCTTLTAKVVPVQLGEVTWIVAEPTATPVSRNGPIQYCWPAVTVMFAVPVETQVAVAAAGVPETTVTIMPVGAGLDRWT